MSTCLLKISRSLFTLAPEKDGQNILLEVFRGMFFPFFHFMMIFKTYYGMKKATDSSSFLPVYFVLKLPTVTCALCGLYTPSWYPPSSCHHPLIDKEFLHNDAVLIFHNYCDFYCVFTIVNGFEVSWICYAIYSNLMILRNTLLILVAITESLKMWNA